MISNNAEEGNVIIIFLCYIFSVQLLIWSLQMGVESNLSRDYQSILDIYVTLNLTV